MYGLDPVKVENQQKDLIIAQLKAEAFELRQKERDYRQLHEQLMNLQHKFSLQEDEKKRNENDLQSKIEFENSNSRSLKREIDDLKVIYDDLVRKGNEAGVDLNGMQRIFHDKQSELELFKMECRKKGDMNQNLRLDLKDQE
eukprot:CAMPEP_0170543760 /NCGR_PEP_ID=MMETSP0211-20121228/2768_1 /TAXON_ID=311385 /ORGANISM="Pseudokeronopsis sp., Strain OXSARD2" /LENGTH=141 /DNA_ID=CAMNT_0010847221 /DNA_START=18 /DNA_END=443 /DNA_ORIENTATION=+